jgi:hypothetical protein
MMIEGEAPVEGPWVDRVNGLENVQVDIVMMRTPDGQGKLELTKFRNPKLVEIEPAIAPPNALGLRSVMFTVESVDDTVARLRANGALSSTGNSWSGHEDQNDSSYCPHTYGGDFLSRSNPTNDTRRTEAAYSDGIARSRTRNAQSYRTTERWTII